MLNKKINLLVLVLVSFFRINSKAWMVRSSQGDYHIMLKLLCEDPRLSKHRDFPSGFTAPHWAAKHGECLSSTVSCFSSP